jgi:beta-glucosidase
MAGDEVAELYLTPPHSNVSPNLALAAFERVTVHAGETKHLIFHLDPRTLSQVDAQGNRAVTAGDYRISIGASQPTGDAATGVLTRQFTIEGTQPLPR